MQLDWNRSVIEEEFGGNANGLKKAGPGAAIESLVKPHGANIPPLRGRKTRIFGSPGSGRDAAWEAFHGEAAFISQAQPNSACHSTPVEPEKCLDMAMNGMVSKFKT